MALVPPLSMTLAAHIDRASWESRVMSDDESAVIETRTDQVRITLFTNRDGLLRLRTIVDEALGLLEERTPPRAVTTSAARTFAPSLVVPAWVPPCRNQLTLTESEMTMSNTAMIVKPAASNSRVRVQVNGARRLIRRLDGQRRTWMARPSGVELVATGAGVAGGCRRGGCGWRR